MVDALDTDNLFGQLRQVESDYRKVVRIRLLIWMLFFCGALCFCAFVIFKAKGHVAFLLIGLVPTAFFLCLILFYPNKVYKYTHYGDRKSVV